MGELELQVRGDEQGSQQVEAAGQSVWKTRDVKERCDEHCDQASEQNPEAVRQELRNKRLQNPAGSDRKDCSCSGDDSFHVPARSVPGRPSSGWVVPLQGRARGNSSCRCPVDRACKNSAIGGVRRATACDPGRRRCFRRMLRHRVRARTSSQVASKRRGSLHVENHECTQEVH